MKMEYGSNMSMFTTCSNNDPPEAKRQRLPAPVVVASAVADKNTDVDSIGNKEDIKNNNKDESQHQHKPKSPPQSQFEQQYSSQEQEQHQHQHQHQSVVNAETATAEGFNSQDTALTTATVENNNTITTTTRTGTKTPASPSVLQQQQQQQQQQQHYQEEHHHHHHYSPSPSILENKKSSLLPSNSDNIESALTQLKISDNISYSGDGYTEQYLHHHEETILVVVQALKSLRRWSDNTNDRNFFMEFEKVEGMSRLTTFLDQLLKAVRRDVIVDVNGDVIIGVGSIVWEYLKHIARIISHCTHNGILQKYEHPASKMAHTFVVTGGIKTMLDLAYKFNNGENGDILPTYGQHANNNDTNATLSTSNINKYRALCYMWGGLMNILSHKIAVDKNVVNEDQFLLVFTCGTRTIRLLKSYNNNNNNNTNKGIIPSWTIRKNVFGTLANILHFQNSKKTLLSISEYDAHEDCSVNGMKLFSTIINDALLLRSKKETKKHNILNNSDNDVDDNTDNEFEWEWDYQLEVWKKASFFFYQCYTHRILVCIDGEKLKTLISFCVQFIKQNPNEAYKASSFHLLQNFANDANDVPAAFGSTSTLQTTTTTPTVPSPSPTSTLTPTSASTPSLLKGRRKCNTSNNFDSKEVMRNTTDFMITLGTILDSRRTNTFGGDDYRIEQRTKDATRKLLKSLL